MNNPSGYTTRCMRVSEKLPHKRGKPLTVGVEAYRYGSMLQSSEIVCSVK
jgi:hypothetical protein